MIVRVDCPSCGASLRIKQPDDFQGAITCPRCRRSFRTALPSIRTASPPAAAEGPPAEATVEEAALPPEKRKILAGVSLGIVVVVVIVALFGGIGLIAGMLWKNRSRPDVAPAVNTPPPGSDTQASPAPPRSRAIVLIQIEAYPEASDRLKAAQEALAGIRWIDPNTIRIDPIRGELGFSVERDGHDLEEAKQALRKAGFQLGDSRVEGSR